MMITVAIYDPDFYIITKIFQPNVYGVQYTTDLNKSGSAIFKIRVKDVQATAANIKVYNRVRIYKDAKLEFTGYIETLNATLTDLTVNCIGLLGIFEKRLFSQTLVAQPGQTAFYAILAAVNAVDDLKITKGVSNVLGNITQIAFNRSTVLSAFEKLATMLGNAEFKINDDLTLDFKTSIGTDKSNTIIIQYISSQVNTSNMLDFVVEVNGRDMSNEIVGTGNSNLLSSKTDIVFKNEFGLLEHVESFTQSNSQTDLDNETQNYLDQHKAVIYNPTVKINVDRLDPDSFEVGDTVRVLMDNGFILVDNNYRILTKAVTVSDNQTLSVDVTLVPSGINILPSKFFGAIVKLGKRLSLLEGK